MGGLGPGIGGGEWFIIGLAALLIVGPERLPVMMRQLGKMVAKARGMANEFRASFDEMARQSELDELRKEVAALRTGQGMHPLGAEADAAFRDIATDLNKPLDAPMAVPAMIAAPDEWPDAPPVEAPAPVKAPRKAAAPKAKAAPKAAKTPAKAKAPKAEASIKTRSGKTKAIRPTKVEL